MNRPKVSHPLFPPPTICTQCRWERILFCVTFMIIMLRTSRTGGGAPRVSAMRVSCSFFSSLAGLRLALTGASSTSGCGWRAVKQGPGHSGQLIIICIGSCRDHSDVLQVPNHGGGGRGASQLLRGPRESRGGSGCGQGGSAESAAVWRRREEAHQVCGGPWGWHGQGITLWMFQEWGQTTLQRTDRKMLSWIFYHWPFICWNFI